MFNETCIESELEDRITGSLWESSSGQGVLVKNGGGGLGAGMSGGS